MLIFLAFITGFTFGSLVNYYSAKYQTEYIKNVHKKHNEFMDEHNKILSEIRDKIKWAATKGGKSFWSGGIQILKKSLGLNI